MNDEPNDDSIFRRVWSTVHELPDTDETVLFDPTRSELLVLSDSGAAIWYLLDGERALADVVTFLRQERADAPKELEHLVAGFVRELLTRGAIEAVR